MSGTLLLPPCPVDVHPRSDLPVLHLVLLLPLTDTLVLLCLSCYAYPCPDILLMLLLLFCPACLFWYSCPANSLFCFLLFCYSCSATPVLPLLFCYSVLLLLFCYSCSAIPVLLFCPTTLLYNVLPASRALLILSWYLCPFLYLSCYLCPNNLVLLSPGFYLCPNPLCFPCPKLLALLS